MKIFYEKLSSVVSVSEVSVRDEDQHTMGMTREENVTCLTLHLISHLLNDRHISHRGKRTDKWGMNKQVHFYEDYPSKRSNISLKLSYPRTHSISYNDTDVKTDIQCHTNSVDAL